MHADWLFNELAVVAHGYLAFVYSTLYMISCAGLADQVGNEPITSSQIPVVVNGTVSHHRLNETLPFFPNICSG